VRWLGPVAIATMPTEIDFSNAGAVREQLLLLLNQGASVLIIDMSASMFCDCAGAGTVMRVYRRASASGAQVRLVSGGPVVRRIFALLGIDRMIDVYPTPAAAIAGREHPRCTRPRDTPGVDRRQVTKGGG